MSKTEAVTTAQRDFTNWIAAIAHTIAHRPLDTALQDHLNTAFPPAGTVFQTLKSLCETGVAEGWLCNREQGGVKFGRILKPGEKTAGFSVDVVEMDRVVGPRHAHPNGEIDMIMALEDGAAFDGAGDGWLVYGPRTAHAPTVTGGKALILYLLPAGAIDFNA
ncbi:MAG: DUF4863 family protein [Alphaproteobacteria bacterium]|nr:DUF4863 family protein [Alphaproteobacteria bacterium]